MCFIFKSGHQSLKLEATFVGYAFFVPFADLAVCLQQDSTISKGLQVHAKMGCGPENSDITDQVTSYFR